MSGKQQYTSTSVAQTKRIAADLAHTFSRGDVVALTGNLGSGKTHFVKGMAPVFGVEPRKVHSPTFALIHEYGGQPPLYHFDCYRLQSAQEALEMGIEEYLYGQGVCVIEWPDRVEQLLPEQIHRITIEATGRSSRTLYFAPKGS